MTGAVAASVPCRSAAVPSPWPPSRCVAVRVLNAPPQVAVALAGGTLVGSAAAFALPANALRAPKRLTSSSRQAPRARAVRRRSPAHGGRAPGHRVRRADRAVLALQRRRLQQRRGGLRGAGRRHRARRAARSLLPGVQGAPAALPVHRRDRLRAASGRLVRTRRCDRLRGAVRDCDVRARASALRCPRRAHRGRSPRVDALPRGREPPGPAGRAAGVLHDDHAVCADPLRALGAHALAVLRGGGHGPVSAREGAEHHLLRRDLRLLRPLARDSDSPPRRPDRARGHGDHDPAVSTRAPALGPGRHGRELPRMAARPPAEPQFHFLSHRRPTIDRADRLRTRGAEPVRSCPWPSLDVARDAGRLLGGRAPGLSRAVAGQGIPVPASSRARDRRARGRGRHGGRAGVREHAQGGRQAGSPRRGRAAPVHPRRSHLRGHRTFVEGVLPGRLGGRSRRARDGALHPRARAGGCDDARNRSVHGEHPRVLRPPPGLRALGQHEPAPPESDLSGRPEPGSLPAPRRHPVHRLGRVLGATGARTSSGAC